jgi:hypothetical protein
MRVYVVVLAVLVGILGGFYGGYKFGQNNVSASASATQSPTRTSGGSTTPGGFGGRGTTGVAALCPSPGAPSPSPGTTALARGTVTNLSSTSMTVTSTACDIKITFGPTVNIQKQVLGTTSDLADNLTVTVTGQRQADGSILAQTIQIGTAGGGFRGTGGGTPGGTSGGGG